MTMSTDVLARPEARVMTGSEAVVEAMRQIDPDVVPVYPITPQTPMIQGYAKLVADGRVQGEMINVESEHSAMSAAIGAALAGARTITATSSQGLALMAEVVYIAAAMRAPIVIALGNRALSGPINIHCDHSDSMLVRDSGAVQLFAENAQEAYDLMLIATRVAERADVLLPVLVCQDGFTITHSAEPVTPLDDAEARAYVGDYAVPEPLLDLARATTKGPFAMPDYYYELRQQLVSAMAAALDAFDDVAEEFAALAGRRYRAIEPYVLEGAERVIVCLGSTGGTVKDVVDELRADGEPVGLLEIRSFRPFPHARVRAALHGIQSVAVLDRADSPGGRPPLFAELAAALTGTDVALDSYVYGLGGRELHPPEIRAVLTPGDTLLSSVPAYLGLRGEPCPG
jgi:pyruvate ferredoxin oxidoreductase alpha subunit